jgi:hypothetical protein
MSRTKKQPAPELPITYTILDYEHLTNRDKDLLITIFHRMKHLPSGVNEEQRIKEMLHAFDVSGYALCKKPI